MVRRWITQQFLTQLGTEEGEDLLEEDQTVILLHSLKQLVCSMLLDLVELQAMHAKTSSVGIIK